MGNNGVKPRIVTPSLITPVDDSRIYVFNKANNLPVYVAEVPGCRFNGLPICLATDKRTETPKVLYMVKEFYGLWERIGNSGIPGVKS